MNAHIARALNAVGSQKQLADRCNVSQAAVSKWARGGNISAESARAIEHATEGVVTVYELRPDIFGPAPGVPPVLTDPLVAAQDKAA